MSPHEDENKNVEMTTIENQHKNENYNDRYPVELKYVNKGASTPVSKGSEESSRIHKLLDSMKFRGKINQSFCVLSEIVFPREVYSSVLLMIACIMLSDTLMTKIPYEFMMARM